jgi:capping protein alpha
MSEDTLSSEDMLQIAQHYLLSSPPGQFNEVLSDVRKIVPNDLLSDSLANGIARISNLKNSKIVVSPLKQNLVIHTAGEIDPSHYFDPVNRVVYSVDHLSLTTGSIDDNTIQSNQNASKESERAALQLLVNNYISASYLGDVAAGGVFAKDDDLTIVLTGEKTSLKNFWSGKWNSVWTVSNNPAPAPPSEEPQTLAESQSQATPPLPSVTLSGEIKIHAHYFEDGNLQLQTSKAVGPIVVEFGSEKEQCERVVEAVRKAESALQEGLEEMFATMNEETFKAMRRVMPITRTKMEWNINAVRMVNQVSRK